jgi:hypothetical protein
MTARRCLRGLCAVFIAAALGACGGGGAAAPASPGTNPAVGGTDSASPLDTLVVMYDVTGDGNPDVLTLDRTTDPYTIREAIVATDAGPSVDRTDQLKGTTIDPDVSRALADWMANTVDVASGSRLNVVDSAGRETTVTIYE